MAIPQLSWREIFLVTLVSMVITTSSAIVMGQDINWDLRNYHFWNVYAWLHDRTTSDVAPGQLQSWHNPLAHALYYVAITHATPVVAGGIIGSYAGINFSLVYILARHVLPLGRPWAIALALLCTAVGASSPTFVSEVGTTFVDNFVSIPVLGALVAICRAHSEQSDPTKRMIWYGTAGFLIGAASGLKLTMLIYVIALTLTLLLLWPRLRIGMKHLTIYIAGCLIGYAVTAGYWNLFLWTEYRNPIFPWYNALFKSSWFEPRNFADTRFLPQSFGDALSYPFQWFLGLHPSSELPFRDARFPFIEVLLPIGLIAAAIRSLFKMLDRRPLGRVLVCSNQFFLIAFFFIISFGVWLLAFAIQRYLIPLELLTGLVLFLAVDQIFPLRIPKFAIFAALAVFCIIWTRPPDWGHIPYGKDWFGVKPSPDVAVPGTVYVLLGYDPLGYVPPYLDESSRYVRLYLNASGLHLDPGSGFGRKVSEILSRHAGSIRTLALRPPDKLDRDQLARFGLDLLDADCKTFTSNFDQLISCSLVRR